MLMEKIENVMKRMRWKAHFYLKKDTSNKAYTSYSFKTRNYLPQCKELQVLKRLTRYNQANKVSDF